MKQTNWEKYYLSPLPTSGWSRMIVRHNLLQMLRKTNLSQGCSIAELGGGGSSFYRKISDEFQTEHYTVYDSCTAGIQAFIRKNPNGKTVKTDLLSFQPDQTFDLVFSVGLIEHFPPESTKKLIKKHFEMTNPDGWVVLFFPTPTLLYRGVRSLAEFSGLWDFPDERPLAPQEVRSTADQYGICRDSKLIYANFLTQYALLYRKKSK
ncbi:MAG: class I SAM-dependent methyltransferase [Lentisphaeria bacterium]|nr:class I SAM-dependent methyltransferase [Lentisphaeria bacterium]